MESDGFLSRQEVVCPPDLLRRAAGQGPAVTAIVGADYPVVLESARQAQWKEATIYDLDQLIAESYGE